MYMTKDKEINNILQQIEVIESALQKIVELALGLGIYLNVAELSITIAALAGQIETYTVKKRINNG